jgi:hypothetical protein
VDLSAAAFFDAGITDELSFACAPLTADRRFLRKN